MLLTLSVRSQLFTQGQPAKPYGIRLDGFLTIMQQDAAPSAGQHHRTGLDARFRPRSITMGIDACIPDRTGNLQRPMPRVTHYGQFIPKYGKEIRRVAIPSNHSRQTQGNIALLRAILTSLSVLMSYPG
ncbi:hypothetical protein [Aquitalea sp. LB_tupeE]|uniref:hypothetical protein n=1 Tax=Aquitalea sp. LB_tupeE TaxID=2748078 RepID=UPI0015BAD971|nr:hypothetical protein [Aquitalea sp. LB_tupeE]NWK76509.1 hypothetical protein [Aquitalea sp. LB_tupeE]